MSFLGEPTVAELADLVRVLDYERGELEAWGQKVGAAWAVRDMHAADAWHHDLTELAGRYDQWRAVVTAQIASVPDQLQTAWPVERVLFDQVRSLVREYVDLDRRIRAAGFGGPSYPNIPQPTRSDLDLEAFKFLDRGLPRFGADVMNGLGLLLLGYLLIQSRERR